MPRRHNHKGRSTTERFVSLPHWMLQSPAWRSLSPVARGVFIELAAIYNGSNNGRLALSARDAAEREEMLPQPEMAPVQPPARQRMVPHHHYVFIAVFADNILQLYQRFGFVGYVAVVIRSVRPLFGL